MARFRCYIPALFASFLLGSCSGSQPLEPAKPTTTPAEPKPIEPLCQVLQPQFDRLTERFNLGGKLLCSDVPGAVTLGQFGVADSLERNILACVDDGSQLKTAVLVEPAAIAGIEYSTTATTNASGTIGLGSIAPWLPDVKAAKGAGKTLHMKLTVTDAIWETLPDLGRVVEGQNHAADCLPTLCHERGNVVYKILKGKVQVVLRTDQSNAFSSSLDLLSGTAGFSIDQTSSSDRSITLGSNERLVLGIVAKKSVAELTDASHCDGCGARGQPCCGNASRCDENLSCLEGSCRPHGYPGAPCDGGRCEQSSVCVHGVCRTGCGAEGLVCCERESCSNGYRCLRGQPARRDVTVLDEVVERTGGLFGTDVEVELGSALCGENRLRSRFATTKVEGDSAHCDQASWILPTDSNDCRVKVHVHVSPFGKIRCHVQVFATEPDPRIPAPQALCSTPTK